MILEQGPSSVPGSGHQVLGSGSSPTQRRGPDFGDLILSLAQLQNEGNDSSDSLAAEVKRKSERK